MLLQVHNASRLTKGLAVAARALASTDEVHDGISSNDKADAFEALSVAFELLTERLETIGKAANRAWQEGVANEHHH